MRRAVIAAGLLLVVFAFGYRLGSPALLDEPNDAQYAEVAREMLDSGDWISPQLDYVLFLNKPPLLYWLIASAYELLGVSELAARLPGTLLTLLTLGLLYRLGRELFDPVTGLLAACLLAGLPSTIFEARFVRPDMALTAATVGALLAFAVARRAQGAQRVRALYGLQIALAAGLLAKGMVGLLLPGFAIALGVLGERRWDLLAAMLAPRGWLLFAALVVPWHVAVALRHEGFAWDYIVNQHLLFFLDAKEPRDSIPISLGEFWMAFGLRLFPWTWWLPLALAAAVRQLRDPAAAPGIRLVLAWGGGTLLFFSAATSRLEHYAVPAVPAAALLVAVLLRGWSGWGARWNRWVIRHLVVTFAVFAAAYAVVPGLLSDIDWLSQRHELAHLAHLLFAWLAVAAALASLAARRFIGPALSAAVLAATPVLHAGMAAIAPINSSAPLAAVIQNTAGADEATLVFEAPIEYQHCAGLNFYLRRKLALLRPPGFVDPPYLARHRDELFIDRARLEQLWSAGPVLFVSDPLAAPTRSIRDIVPQPFYIVARTHDRFLISNQPQH